jgi:hypothetical protein
VKGLSKITNIGQITGLMAETNLLPSKYEAKLLTARTRSVEYTQYIWEFYVIQNVHFLILNISIKKRTRVGLVFLCFSRLPQDGTPVQKHVAVDTHHQLHFIVYILLYFTACICCSIY